MTLSEVNYPIEAMIDLVMVGEVECVDNGNEQGEQAVGRAPGVAAIFMDQGVSISTETREGRLTSLWWDTGFSSMRKLRLLLSG